MTTHPPATPEEPMILSRDLDSPGLAYWRRHSLKPMSMAETADCFRRWREAGDVSAYDRIIRSNVRFAIRVASEYVSARRTIDELLSDTVCGMARACETFDPAAGYRFITYAVWWMRQYCAVALMDESRVVRYPQQTYGHRRAVERITESRAAKGQPAPTDAELIAATGLSRANIADARAAAARDMGIDTPMSDYDHLTIAGSLRDPAPGPVDALAAEERREIAVQMLDDLEPRLRYVITRYYGLDGEPAYTLEQVAKRLHLSRERVRQLHERAVAVVRMLHGQVPVGTRRSAHRLDRQRIEAAMARTTSTATAARLLGVSRGYLLELCHRYGIEIAHKGAAGDCRAGRASAASAARLAELMEDDERIARNKALDAVETAIVSTGMVVAT